MGDGYEILGEYGCGGGHILHPLAHFVIPNHNERMTPNIALKGIRISLSIGETITGILK